MVSLLNGHPFEDVQDAAVHRYLDAPKPSQNVYGKYGYPCARGYPGESFL